MAKKFGKFLLFTAAVGSAAAAVYYYIRKKDAESEAPEDEDDDDFNEDLDDEADSSRNYVPLTPDTDTQSDEAQDTFVPLEQVAQNAEKTETGESDNAEPEVEEFFEEKDDEEK